ncbi:MAG: peptide chain release factor N(5)-glutamine methyltransferase [Paludibacteraceae bacterium]|nr:peptide chain release factor N(5)-glutamine methyltransferase [Paludibacteraceae bacterium]
MNPTIAYVMDRLRPEYTEREARELAYCVVSYLTGLSTTELLLRQSPIELHGLEGILNRLLQHMPVEYLIGHGEWMGLTLRLDATTLIPRPETAELVEWILHDEQHTPQRVLDIGTGSGCIAIALKRGCPQWIVEGLDESELALYKAIDNAKNNGQEIEFYVHDILKPWNRKYDIVVSNPPYIPVSEMNTLDKNIRYEPMGALFVPDEDPLVFYRTIARQRLAPTLYFEINERYGQAMVELMQTEDYTDIELRQDQYGKDRMLRARTTK